MIFIVSGVLSIKFNQDAPYTYVYFVLNTVGIAWIEHSYSARYTVLYSVLPRFVHITNNSILSFGKCNVNLQLKNVQT